MLPVRHAHAHGQLPSPAGLLPPAGLSGFLLKLAGSAPHTAGPRAAMDLKLLVQKVHLGPPRTVPNPPRQIREETTGGPRCQPHAKTASRFL